MAEMISRADFMDEKVSFDEYYNQFVDQKVITLVVDMIGADTILESKDEHFNDIPLADWDAVGACLPNIKWPKDDWSSRSGLVCIGKQAAARYKRMALKTHVGTGATLH